MKLTELIELTKKLGVDVEVDPEELKAYFAKLEKEENLYLPKIPKGFYFNPQVFRKLVGL